MRRPRPLPLIVSSSCFSACCSGRAHHRYHHRLLVISPEDGDARELDAICANSRYGGCQCSLAVQLAVAAGIASDQQKAPADKNSPCLRKTSRVQQQGRRFSPPRFPFLSPPLCYPERTTSVRKRQPFLRLHWIPLSGCIFPFLPHDLRCANWVHTALGTQRHWERMCHAFRPIGPTTRRRCQAHTAMAHA